MNILMIGLMALGYTGLIYLFGYRIGVLCERDLWRHSRSHRIEYHCQESN